MWYKSQTCQKSVEQTKHELRYESNMSKRKKKLSWLNKETTILRVSVYFSLKILLGQVIKKLPTLKTYSCNRVRKENLPGLFSICRLFVFPLRVISDLNTGLGNWRQNKIRN